MSSRRFHGMLCLVCVFAIVLTACGGASSSAPAASKAPASSAAPAASSAAPAASSAAPAASSAAAPAKAAELKPSIIYRSPAEPQALDPQNTNQDTPSSVAVYLANETLLTEAAGEPSKFEPLLCESYKISDDGKEITFNLRKGIKFHSGNEMKAEDVAFSINRAIGAKAAASIVGPMDKAEVVDDYTVKLLMKYPYMPILACMTSHNLAIVEKKFVENCESKGLDLNRNVNGTGRWKFNSWASGDQIVYDRFEDYWGSKATAKQFILKTMTDGSTASIALENKEIDVIGDPEKSDLQNIGSKDYLQVLETAGAGVSHVFFNLSAPDDKDPEFKVKEVRQAVAHVINREDVLLAAHDGFGVTNECPVAPSVFGFDANAKFWPIDVNKAKELMKQGGFEKGFDCIMNVTQGGWYAKAATVVQAEVAEIGIKLEVAPMEKGTYDQLVRGECLYGISLHLANAPVPDADYVLHRRFTSYNIGFNQNIYGISSPEMDKLFDTARTSMDAAERQKLYSEFYEYNKDMCIYIPMTTPNTYLAAKKDIANAFAHPTQRNQVWRYDWAA